MPEALTLRAARPEDATRISALAMRSKAFWGYTACFMEACRSELTYAATDFDDEKRRIVVAEIQSGLAGFFALAAIGAGKFELEALFVEPARIGKGIGRKLLDHAKNGVAESGGGTLLIQGDPHAERFYRAAGGKSAGSRESGSIPGRMLPLFEIKVDASPPKQ